MKFGTILTADRTLYVWLIITMFNVRHETYKSIDGTEKANNHSLQKLSSPSYRFILAFLRNLVFYLVLCLVLFISPMKFTNKPRRSPERKLKYEKIEIPDQQDMSGLYEVYLGSQNCIRIVKQYVFENYFRPFYQCWI